MRHILLLIVIMTMLVGCKHSGNTDSESSAVPYVINAEGEMTIPGLSAETPVAILDSMLCSLYVDASPASKARHEWEWAKRVRLALGMTAEVADLDSLTDVSNRLDDFYAPLTAYSQYDMNEAAGVFACTAKFRMLNAYQALDSLMIGSLGSNDLFNDYLLWEGVNQEYEDNYTDGGSSGPMMLSFAYRTFCKLRRAILMEEIGYLDVEHEGAAEWYVEADEIRWKPEQKAIRLWYDHRMKMADKLGNANSAEYLRRMTYKTVFIYHHLQLDWMYDFEHL